MTVIASIPPRFQRIAAIYAILVHGCQRSDFFTSIIFPLGLYNFFFVYLLKLNVTHRCQIDLNMSRGEICYSWVCQILYYSFMDIIFYFILSIYVPYPGFAAWTAELET